MTIPHKQQRYETVGDWFTNKHDGTVNIRVSELGSWRFELLVAIHELVEAFQCMHDGVTEESVDKFDKQYVGSDNEPGDDVNAPYRRQHCLATGIERILASTLGVDWSTYEEKLSRLVYEEQLGNGVVKCSECLRVLGSQRGIKKGSFIVCRPCADHPTSNTIIEWEPENHHA